MSAFEFFVELDRMKSKSHSDQAGSCFRRLD